MAHNQKSWTEPQIYPKNAKPCDLSKTWRVWFRFFHSGKWSYISRKGDHSRTLGSIKNFKERLAFAGDIQAALKYRLEVMGWNPITNSYPTKTAKEIEVERLSKLSFSEALDFAYKKKKPDWSHKTGQDYSSIIKYLKQAGNALGFTYTPIKELRRPHYKLLLEEVTGLRALAPTGYNKYREFLSSLITEMVEWDVVEHNFIHDIKTKQVEKRVAHRPPTQDQRLLIVEKIKINYPEYYRFLAVLYGCTIRPVEITRLQIKHLHKLEGIFRLPAPITKKGIEREVPIPDWVMDLLSELNLHAYPPEYFIFSGKGAMFLPGKKQMGKNAPTRWWRNIVKKPRDKGGLDLEVSQYSLKKLSGDDMVRLQRREGATNLLELPRIMMGHANQDQTETYVSEHKEVMKELIQKKMPHL
jgi:integrase